MARRISFWRIERGTLDVRFPMLDDEQNAALRQRIALHYGACGCHQGRQAGFATLAIFVLMLLTGIISIGAIGIARVVLLYFALSFVTMLVAKMLGLRRARRSLYQLADELDSTFNARVHEGMTHG